MAAAEEYIANIHEASETQLALIVFHVGLSYAQSRTPCFSEMSSAVQEWKPTLIPQVLPGENEEKCKQSNVSVTTAWFPCLLYRISHAFLWKEPQNIITFTVREVF